MCLNALKCDINLFEEVPERFSEDSKCKELGRCKGGDGDCKVTFWTDEDGESGRGGRLTQNCRICHKVVCELHFSDCNECRRFSETTCEECSEDCTAILYHYD